MGSRSVGLVGVGRSTLGYELRLPAKDVPVIETMKSLSAQYQRCGYWRIDASMICCAPTFPV